MSEWVYSPYLCQSPEVEFFPNFPGGKTIQISYRRVPVSWWGSWSKVGKVPIFMDNNFDMGLLAVNGPFYFHPFGRWLLFDGLLGDVLHVDVGKCNCTYSNLFQHITNWCQFSSVVKKSLHILLGKGGIIQKSENKSHWSSLHLFIATISSQQPSKASYIDWMFPVLGFFWLQLGWWVALQEGVCYLHVLKMS